MIAIFILLLLLSACSSKKEESVHPEEYKESLWFNPPPRHYPFQYDIQLRGLNNSELWSAYNSARASAQKAAEDNRRRTAIDSLLMAGEAALLLNRPDIASWQFNNAAHHVIRIIDEELKEGEGDVVEKRALYPYGNIINWGLIWLLLAEDANEESFDSQRAGAISRNRASLLELRKKIEK